MSTTCPGPKWLVLIIIFMCLGYMAVVIGLFLPFWLQGRGYDVGLFYQCRDEACIRQDTNSGATLSLVIALIIIGLIVMGIGLLLAFIHLRRKHQGLAMTAYTTVGVPLFTITGAFLALIGVLVYCTSVYDEDTEHSLNKAPWIVVFGAALNGICSLLFLLIAKCNNFQVDILDENKKEIYGLKHQQKEHESSYWDNESLEEAEKIKKIKKRNFLRKKAEDKRNMKEDTAEESLDEQKKDDEKQPGKPVIELEVIIKQDKATQTKRRKDSVKRKDKPQRNDDGDDYKREKEIMRPDGENDGGNGKPMEIVGMQTCNDAPFRDGDGRKRKQKKHQDRTDDDDDDDKRRKKIKDKRSEKDNGADDHRYENKENDKENETKGNSERSSQEDENRQQHPEKDAPYLSREDNQTNSKQDRDDDKNNHDSDDSGNDSGKFDANTDKDSNGEPDIASTEVVSGGIGYQASLPLTWVWRKRNTTTVLGHRAHLYSKDKRWPYTKDPWH